MADHDWPSSLPKFLVEGYQGGGGEDGVLRSRVGRGSKLRAQWTTPPPEPVTAQILCTRSELQVLRLFYLETLRQVEAFNHRDFTKPDSETVEYRFLSRPSWVPIYGDLWRVTLMLEQLTEVEGTFALTDETDATLLTEADEELTT